jgi:2-isopropylmalate synthase
MHDWNRPDPHAPPHDLQTLVVDETLRDGLQSPSVRNPRMDQKVALVHAMATIGIDVVSVGLPAAHRRAVDDAVALVKEITNQRLPLRPTAAARTTENDVNAIAEVSQRAGASVEVYSFIGSSPIRHLVEGWDLGFLLGCVETAALTARRAGLPFTLVTEDTTRAHPKVLTEVFTAAVHAGASRLCLCDTVGHVEPRGVETLVAFVRDLLKSLGASHVGLDWHGHNDRGLGVANALTAARVGVGRVHATALGIGERVGNVSAEQLLYNLAMLGFRSPPPLDKLRAFADLASDALGVEVPHFEPLVGAVSRGLDPHRAAPLAAPPRTPALRDEPLVPLQFRVNDEPLEIAARPSRTLLELLRYDLDLVGTKQGCDKGDCGACTVLIDGEPQLSCLTLSLDCQGRSVTTVESLAGPPRLDPLLDAFDRCGAGQCGFCTPGMLMAATGLLAREPKPSRETIQQSLAGNLCRCTGYGAIFDAVELAARIRAGEEPSAIEMPGSEHVPPALPRNKERGP